MLFPYNVGMEKLDGVVSLATNSPTAKTGYGVQAKHLVDKMSQSGLNTAKSLPMLVVKWSAVSILSNMPVAIRKLKDDDGQYILDVVAGGPSTILGFPVFENPAMASIGSGNKSVIFGYLADYKVVTTGLDVAVSSDAKFEEDVTVFRYTTRVDGKLAHDSHVKFLTTS